MEKIKFRLIKDNKIVGYEIPMEQPNGIFGWEYQINYIPKEGELVGQSGYSGIFIKHDIKNQFTGLKDKNGREIYEGDVVKDEDRIIGVVEFINGMFTYDIFALVAKQYPVEIIGNIHENSELLKD